MKEVDVATIRKTITELCLEANFELRSDVLRAIKKAVSQEKNLRAKNILKSIIENARIAKLKRLAICQDTGMVTVFVELGQEVAIAGGGLREAIDRGIEEAYKQGHLRRSIVEGPFTRKNTNTNTPAVIFTDVVEGDLLKLSVSIIGFGSENKSSIEMFNPTDGVDKVKNFVLDVVRQAGPDACPPFVLGIGIGGTFAQAAYLAREALLRPIEEPSPKRHIAKLERELLKEINSLGIGPMGLGGKTTALGVNILEFPTHIAGLPVAVNVSCHATRSAERVL